MMHIELYLIELFFLVDFVGHIYFVVGLVPVLMVWVDVMELVDGVCSKLLDFR